MVRTLSFKFNGFNWKEPGFETLIIDIILDDLEAIFPNFNYILFH